MFQFNSLLILSADILDKSGSKEKPVEPELFLIGGKRFKKATLSLGWTSDGAESSYSDEEINEMSNIVKKYKVIQPLTFRMNVLRAVNNLNGVARLIYSKPSTTLSLFSRDSERVGVKNLNELVKTFGANKIYLSGLQNANKKLEAYLLWLKP